MVVMERGKDCCDVEDQLVDGHGQAYNHLATAVGAGGGNNNNNNSRVVVSDGGNNNNAVGLSGGGSNSNVVVATAVHQQHVNHQQQQIRNVGDVPNTTFVLTHDHSEDLVESSTGPAQFLQHSNFRTLLATLLFCNN